MGKSRPISCLVFAAVLLLVPACAEKDLPSSASGTSSPGSALPASVSMVQPIPCEKGVVTWYGRELNGRKTASGETFDMNGYTAAHRTLPFGTVIRVLDIDTGKSVQVRVNDRGPFMANRVLELSYGAARELGIISRGIATVEIEITVPIPENAATSRVYTVQAAVFTEQENAQLLKDRLSRKFELISILPFETNLGTLYRVRVGSYGTEEKARVIAGKLKLEGLEPVVLRKD